MDPAKIPKVWKNQEINTHGFVTFAKFFPLNLQIKDASAKEKYIDEPTNPKYNSGGCIASAGSCNIGLRPKPSWGTGNILLNGFEVVIKKIKKPIINIF